MIDQDSQKQRRLQDAEAASLLGEDILEEVVDMTDGHAHQIHPDRVAQNYGEAQQNVRQVRRQEIEQPEEVHANEWITSGPDVDQHDGERLAEEQQVDEERKDLE